MTLRDALKRPIIAPVPTTRTRRRIADGATTLADIIAPMAIDRRRASMLLAGDTWFTTMVVRAFPAVLGLAWLDDLRLALAGSGTVVHQRITPVDDALARQLLARSEDTAIGTLTGDARAGMHLDADAQQGMEAAAQLRRDLVAGTDRLVRYSIALTVSAATPDELADRVATIRRAAAQLGVILSVPPFRQWEGYRGALPLAFDELGLVHDSSARAAAMGLPVGAPGIGDQPEALLCWGEHPRTGRPICWDRWDATNPHALVIAESGCGKTYAVSGLIAQEVALGGEDVLILDPKYQEYRPLITGLGGAYITLSRSAGCRINPLALPRLTDERIAEVAALEEDLLGQRITFIRALIVRELRASGMLVDAVDVTLLEQAIQQAYADHGINSDPRTFGQPMPTFSTIQHCLERHTGSEAERLARALTLFTRGTVGDLFNAPGTLDLSGSLVGLDVSPLLRSQDDMLARLIPVIVMDCFVSAALHRSPGRRSHLVLDEAHAILRSDAGAQTLATLFRIGRALRLKVTLITQAISDLDESAATSIVLENARTKLLLGLNRDSAAVARAAAILGLNEAEARYLATCRLTREVGATALLLADGRRTPLLVPHWPPAIHRLIVGASAAHRVGAS